MGGNELEKQAEQGTFSNNILSAEALHMSALQKLPHYYLSQNPFKDLKYLFDLTFYSPSTLNCLKLEKFFKAYCK